MRREILLPLLIIGFLIVATTLVVIYGKGYRLSFGGNGPDILGTGLLVATSEPDGASVFINGHLTTATDNTINLAPGVYTVKIFKDGYFPWEKKLKVQKEVVTKADALLFPNAPKLESITNVGVRNPVLDPTQSRIAYAVGTQSARKNGIYVLDLSTRPILTLQSSQTQIVDDTSDLFSQSIFDFSPDGSELIATISATSTSYLLNSKEFNIAPRDVTTILPSIDVTWKKQRDEKEKARLDSLPKPLKKTVLDNFEVLAWSLDDLKVLYKASKSGELAIVIKPRLIGVDTTAEQRKIEKGSLYVYDIKEDKNYKILDSKEFASPPKISWFPDSGHLIYVHDQKIEIMEYDGQNRTTIYAGPFVDGFVFPWPDASKVVILTNLGNPDIPPNLYKIVLK